MLDEIEGRAEPADSHFPEDWIASTTAAVNKGREHFADEGLSRVEIGGRPQLLRDVFQQFPDETLGRAHFERFGAHTGFLLKFLDAAVRLHVQCHPTVRFARERLNSPAGKTEAYVILSTRPEAAEPCIYLGFQRPPSRAELRRAVVEQRVDAILAGFDPIAVQPGDVFLVPGGRPHAIGAGVFMIEIMEPTDLVVRIEFERGGYVLPEASRFMGRDVDFALSMFDFEPVSADDVRQRFFGRPRLVRRYGNAGEEHSLIDERLTRCFEVRRLQVRSRVERQEPGFHVAIVTQGTGEVSAGAVRREVRLGDRFLVPARTERVAYESGQGMELVLALPPRPDAQSSEQG